MFHSKLRAITFWLLLSAVSIQISTAQEYQRKKILIFFCGIGGGHISASTALASYLHDDYEVTRVNIFGETLRPLDVVRSITNSRYSNEDLCNYLFTRLPSRCIDILASFGSWVIDQQQSSMDRLLYDYLASHKPDLVISVAPHVNGALARVTQELSLPLIIIPTDLDATDFVDNLEAPYHKQLFYTYAFDDPALLSSVVSKKIPKEQLRILGFPIRSEFLKRKDIAALKREFNVPTDKPIVMILMGSLGSKASYHYVKNIAKTKLPLHIIVCLGRNEHLHRAIETIRLPPGMSISIFGFTQRVADLMALSDVLITKPGTVSVCEALHAQVPIIIDNTRGCLPWERFNLTFIQDHKFGDVLTSFNDLKDLLIDYLFTPNYRSYIKTALKNYSKPHFETEIRSLVALSLKGNYEKSHTHSDIPVVQEA